MIYSIFPIIYSDHFLMSIQFKPQQAQNNSLMSSKIKTILVQFILISFITSSPILEPTELEEYMFTQQISGDLQFLQPCKLVASSNWPNPIEIYQITAVKATHQFLPDSFPSTTIYSFAGKINGEFKAGFPGVSLLGMKNMPLYVTYTNKIEGRHFLPLDFSIPFDMVSRFFQNQVPIVPHAHGLETQMGSDGQPMGFWSKTGAKGPDYFSHKSQNKSSNQAIFRYHNTKQGLYWIHDHTMAITRLNVYAGLLSFFQIVDPEISQQEKNILEGMGELQQKFFVIADRTFRKDGSLYYPEQSQSGFFTSWVPEFFGNTITVNGKVWPKIRLQPKKYRFVFLNACQSRFLNLFFMQNNLKLNFQIIRRDSDYLREPVNVKQHLLVLGARVQIVIDLTYVKNQVLIANDAPTPYPMGDQPDQFDGSVMKIEVVQKINQKGNKKVNTVPSSIMNRINFYLQNQPLIKTPEQSKQFQFIDQPQRKSQNKIMLRLDGQEQIHQEKVITIADFKNSNNPNSDRSRAFFNDQISRVEAGQKITVKKLMEGVQYRKQRLSNLLKQTKIKFQSTLNQKQTKTLIKNTTYPKFQEGTPYFTILTEVFDKQGNTLTMKIDDIDLRMGCKGAVFKQAQTYDFYIINLTMDDHPIHIHLINFQIIGRFKFDVAAYQKQWIRINGQYQPFGIREVPKQVDSRTFKTGQLEPPLQEQKLFIDTINVPAGYTTIARVRLDNHYGKDFPFNVTGSKYVWHCHILQHQDNEMMRYFCIE